MKSRKTLVCLWVTVALVILALPLSSGAATFLKQVTHTDPATMMGQTQPARDDTSSIWMAKDMACMMNSDNTAIIVRSDKGMFYLIDHNKKSYSELPIESLGDMAKMAGLEGAEGEQHAKMMQGMMGSMKVTVTPTEEIKKIMDWNAKKYTVEMSMAMGTTTGEYWASDEIKLDYEMFQLISSAFMAQMPGYQDILTEMKKIKGVTVESATEANVMGSTVKTTTKVLEYAEKDAPEGAFDVPKDYKKIDMSKMGPGR